MRAIKTTVTIAPDGTLTARVPPDIPPGEHQAVLVLDEEVVTEPPRPLTDFPVDSYGPWPENLSLRREDLYDDWGR